MIKISIVMAHYKREEFLYRALWGYRHLHTPEELEDVEFVVVDDDGGKSSTFWKVIELHKRALKITAASLRGTRNPSLPMNFGIKLATGQLVALTNAENVPYVPHMLTDIKQRLDGTDKLYLSCGCYNLDVNDTANAFSKVDWTKLRSVVGGLRKIKLLPRMGARGRSGWYNHSTHRPAHLYFLVALPRENLLSIGGFDEDYAKGRAFEDADLIMRLRRSGVKIVPADDLVCIHPHHYNAALDMSRERIAGLKRNQELFKAKRRNKSFVANSGREWGKPKNSIIKKWNDK